MKRIDISGDNVEWLDIILCIDRIPITGMTYEHYDNGKMASEGEFVNGFTEGVQRDWYRNGNLKELSEFKHGSGYGFSIEFHESGRVKYVGHYEYGARLDEKEWSEDGELIRDYNVNDNAADLKLLESHRESKKKWLEVFHSGKLLKEILEDHENE